GLARRGFAVSGHAFVPGLSLESISPPVATSLRESTVRIASAVAKGRATCPEVISARALELSKGVLLTMFLPKFKHVVTSFSLAASIATGAVLLARQPASTTDLPATKQSAPRGKVTEKPLPADAPSHEPKTEQSPWKRSLPNGVTVALLGVTTGSRDLTAGLQWSPGGSRIPRSLVLIASVPRRHDQDKKIRAFVIRVWDPEDPEGVHVDWEFPGAIVSDTAERCDFYYGKAIPGGFGAIVQLPKAWSSCTARVRIAAGPWATAATTRGLEERENVTFGSHVITFSRARAIEQDTSITVDVDLKDIDKRLIAFDHDGQVHKAIDLPSKKEMPGPSTVYRFPISPDRIEEFRFQTRSFERVEFGDILLEPRTIDDTWPVERLRLDPEKILRPVESPRSFPYAPLQQK
ncbi:hypothetical protein ACYOEI_15795, partial [Singulisphaera rosea]